LHSPLNGTIVGQTRAGMSESDPDPYWKLRPAPPTPLDELCGCASGEPLLLRSVLGPNPLACARCNLEVPPERLPLPHELADSVAAWRSFHDSFYVLWLDSNEFEDWARSQLQAPDSVVNRRALSLRAELEPIRRTYYWWFQDTGADDFSPLSSCPICSHALADVALAGLVCQRCSVLVAH
jgi:hypothetical protein